MEFSKSYREQILTDFRNVLNFDDETAQAKQVTYFFSGALPTQSELQTIIRDEWTAPAEGVEPKTPDDATSALNANYLGKIEGLLAQFAQDAAYTQIEASNTEAADVASNTASVDMPIAVVGDFAGQSLPVLTGFDHATKGHTEVTWALTLWGVPGANAPTYRDWYIRHRVGAAADPLAELVLSDPLLAETDPALPVVELYNPLF